MACLEFEPECDGSTVVHVCALSLRRDVEWPARLGESLSPKERARARRFLQEADRRRFLLGRAVVRFLGGVHLGIDPANVRLDQTLTGKPYLANPLPIDRKPFEFNVAHSGDCVLIAWTEGRAVGVDVEAYERRPATWFDDVSESVFSDGERAALSASMPDDASGTFYRIWVRKEAVLKAEGCGVAGALRSFSVACPRGGRTEWFDEVDYPESGRIWTVVDLTPAPGHLAALALPAGSVLCLCRPQDFAARVGAEQSRL